MKIEHIISIEDAQKWADELRSGNFVQARGTLEEYPFLTDQKKHVCCLGAACYIFIPSENLVTYGEKGLLQGTLPENYQKPPEESKWLLTINEDFYKLTGKRLSKLNDEGLYFEEGSEFSYLPFTFDEIADMIELVYVHRILDEDEETTS